MGVVNRRAVMYRNPLAAKKREPLKIKQFRVTTPYFKE